MIGTASVRLPATVAPQYDSCSYTSEYPVKPKNSVAPRRPIPIIQFSSRGLRYAPVKNTRIMCRMTAAIIKFDDQRWMLRRNQPNGTIVLTRFTDSYACEGSGT